MASTMKNLTFLIICALYLGATEANSKLSYTTEEELPKQTFIGNIANDGRLRNNLTADEFASLRFSLLPQRNSHFKLFFVEERTGVLVTAQKLDRESLCGQNPVCSVNVSVATLSTISNFFSIFNITITIEDTNDNAPVFPNNDIQVTFLESAKVGDSFQLQVAIDRDVGANSAMTYDLQGTDGTFGLEFTQTPEGKGDLKLILKRPVEHETSHTQKLVLIARDGGSPPKITSATITISITDVNDHWPIFTEIVYEVSIYENTPKLTTLIQVRADDLDKGMNGQVSYRFPSLTDSNVRDRFFLNASTGDMVLQEVLDYESVSRYEFTIEALDGGTPPKTTESTIIINVLDVNDNDPAITFNLPPGREYVTISEFATLGEFVTRMSVFDGDSGKDGEVMCTLSGKRFQLKHIFGSEFKILLNSTLDRETEATVNATINCHDRGVPPREDVKMLIINVQDENDNAPKFQHASYALSVAENLQRGEVLETTVAMDLDVGNNGKVFYELNAVGNEYFLVRPNGHIVVNGELDREKTPMIQFEVIAVDNADPFHSATAIVRVTLLDENDEPPHFNAAILELSVRENQAIGTTVGNVIAIDPDLGEGGQVSYQFSEDLTQLPFVILPNNGTITTNKNLNREEESEYTFTVIATDNGDPRLTGSVVVIVTVSDQNDNSPVFQFPNDTSNTVNIYTSHKVGERIADVKAQDLDDKENSRLTFSIKDNGKPSKFFNINSKTGVITLTQSMQNYGKQTLEVVIVARDNGQSKRSSEARLFVVVSLDSRPLPMPDGLTGKTNLTIAICILTVSAIISGTIVVVICIVRRRDNKDPKLAEKSEEAPQTETGHNSNSLYDTKKASSVDIIIKREGANRTSQQDFSAMEKDDSMGFKIYDASNPTFQVFPAKEDYPKMGYTEDMLVKSDRQSNSSTGDSGRGLSQEDIQWLHNHPGDFDHLHSLEEEQFSQSSVHSSQDHGIGRSGEPMSHDFRWSGQRSTHMPSNGQNARSYQVGKLSPGMTIDYHSSFT